MTEDAEALVSSIIVVAMAGFREKTGSCPVIERQPAGGYLDMDTAARASSARSQLSKVPHTGRHKFLRLTSAVYMGEHDPHCPAI